MTYMSVYVLNKGKCEYATRFRKEIKKVILDDDKGRICGKGHIC